MLLSACHTPANSHFTGRCLSLIALCSLIKCCGKKIQPQVLYNIKFYSFNLLWLPIVPDCSALCAKKIFPTLLVLHTQTRSCQYTSRSSDSSELDNLASDIHDATTADQGLDSVTVCQDSLDPAELSDSSVEEQSEVELAPEIWDADSDSDNDGEIRSISDNLKNVQFILSYFILFFFNFVIEFLTEVFAFIKFYFLHIFIFVYYCAKCEHQRLCLMCVLLVVHSMRKTNA